jgi:hypothetical protein
MDEVLLMSTIVPHSFSPFKIITVQANMFVDVRR